MEGDYMIYIYKDYISNVEIMGDDVCRYLLSFTLQDCNNKSALVIMQNPSKATKNISDQTINTVLEVLHKFGYKNVYITNLVPYYATDSNDISELVKDKIEVHQKNDNIIKEKIKSVDKIFVAWGGRNGFKKDFYNLRLSAIKKLLINKTVYCYKVNDNGTPIHPSRNQWSSSAREEDFIKYSL